MSQELISGVQKTTGWLFVGSGPLAFITQNATALTVIITGVTGLIYASCAIWNAVSNWQRNKVNRRTIEDDILRDIRNCDFDPEIAIRISNVVRNKK